MNKKDILKYLADNKRNVTPNDCNMEIGCPECREILKMECPYFMTADWAKTELAALPKSRLEEAREYVNSIEKRFAEKETKIGTLQAAKYTQEFYEFAISELQEQIKELQSEYKDCYLCEDQDKLAKQISELQEKLDNACLFNKRWEEVSLRQDKEIEKLKAENDIERNKILALHFDEIENLKAEKQGIIAVLKSAHNNTMTNRNYMGDKGAADYLMAEIKSIISGGKE